MTCSGCRAIQPIEDQGTVRFLPTTPVLIHHLEDEGYFVAIENGTACILYQDREQLLYMLRSLRKLPEELKNGLTLSIDGSKSDIPENWFPLSLMEQRVENYDIVSIIIDRQFTSHMQPIVDRSQAVVGYEFLLRPSQGGAPFQPYKLFDVARTTGLHSFLDRAARISAIETGAQFLPRGFKRFINFLPSSIYNPEYCLTHTFEAIERLEQDPNDFVFEVVETEKIESMARLQRIFDVYRQNGISVALDDVGSGYSTVEVLRHLEPDYVKIDRGLVDGCDTDTEKQRQISEIIESASRFGGQVLAEGIERPEEFRFCREAGITLAQGYLFGKPTAHPLSVR
ncbi:EAL domain-containing protein [Paenibacillus sp. JX-17]|uniref:EAL domain-containing protein n=1 Tax=Paenibacillus lacisoli TaxID=3064525 RepID=A0ABT9CBZ6_9BACL|nr:EAL domain-containing protein [Paenibacillus sp. JX-17]MDO7906779.1 EAL domain-containing protein [Paenibacillus sp. JX-17]